MNVLLLTDKLIMGGAEMYYCKLVNQLKHPEITFYYAAAKGELFNKIKGKHHFTELSRTNHLKNIRTLLNLVDDRQITLIHANSLRMVLYSILLKKLFKRPIKVIYTKHNITILEKKFPLGFMHLMNIYVNRIITVSGSEKGSLEQLGVQDSKIRTIYNGVDLEQFVFHRKESGVVFNIGILARLSEEKNHALFIQIANELKNRPNVMFYIAGNGPEKQKISDLIRSYNLSGKVKMLGEVQNPEDFIRDMDILLLTSNREVFPMVIIESMAIGTPVISIDKGGIKEAVIQDETGVLIKSHSVEEFSNQIIRLESDQLSRMRISKQARQKVEREFSLEQMAKQTLEEYLNFADDVKGYIGVRQ
ncbi:glycosyltransferase family 4 protein [Bacillus sp. FJAT-27251]|uniref:glycosyltransferase family 4 protein n=1 Tax=Bacillus sp. FJAT-27251 TaxID=1684142 RepID=UPI0006A7666E|nr:glycosyltransferase family 4 protein [Bacillus sp. FJAT-27251]